MNKVYEHRVYRRINKQVRRVTTIFTEGVAAREYNFAVPGELWVRCKGQAPIRIG